MAAQSFLDFSVINVFLRNSDGSPLRGRWIQVSYVNFAIVVKLGRVQPPTVSQLFLPPLKNHPWQIYASGWRMQRTRSRAQQMPTPVSHCVFFDILSRVSTLTSHIDIAIQYVRLSVCPWRSGIDENGLTYCHSFFSPYGSPIILALSTSNIFTKFRWGHPLLGR